MVLNSLKVTDRESVMFNMFIDFEPMKRFENGSNVSEFRGFDNSTGKRILNQLQSMYVGLWKVVIYRITAV